jgi:tetratricopeptide (TPR) repeat protein
VTDDLGDNASGAGPVDSSGGDTPSEESRTPAGIPRDPAAGDPYALFVRGTELLEQRNYSAAAVSLEAALKLEPGKTSILEALGRAYFHAQNYRFAANVFQEVIDARPDDDFAQFCLGRSLEKLGDVTGARRHMALALGMRPGRTDYRRYADRLRGDDLPSADG